MIAIVRNAAFLKSVEKSTLKRESNGTGNAQAGNVTGKQKTIPVIQTNYL